MYTFKIKQIRALEDVGTVPTTSTSIEFHPATSIVLGEFITSFDDWERIHAKYFDQDKCEIYDRMSRSTVAFDSIVQSRIVRLDVGNPGKQDSTWWAVSQAWILGPDGGTIERVTAY